jgi:hypothetical protein
MSNAEEATVNPDGSSTFEDTTPPVNDAGDAGFEDEGFETPPMEELVKGGIDPAFYLLFAALIAAALYYYFVVLKKEDDTSDDFFSSLEGDKVRIFTPVAPFGYKAHTFWS